MSDLQRQINQHLPSSAAAALDPSEVRTTLRQIYDNNISTLKQSTLSEISGSLGDLGTFLPILISLSTQDQISLSTTLVFTGVYNVATGFLFGIPLPVQPMKAIAAVSIIRRMSAGEVAAAGIFVSGSVSVFSVTGALEWFTKQVPIPVVKGIQVGAGLSLVVAAGRNVLGDLKWLGPSWADNLFWVGAALLALLLGNVWQKRFPFALVTTVLGVVFGILRILEEGDKRYHGYDYNGPGSGHHRGGLPGLRLWRPSIRVPRAWEWAGGILNAGLGQLPLTMLNSIVAVTHLAADLLPQVNTPSVTSIGYSVAAMNLVGCWFGAMPVCHGSGGLAAQYKFGARSGSSVAFLGALKVILGLVFGESLEGILKKFPVALLAVMIIAAGLELANVGESLNTAQARDLKDNSGFTGVLGEEERKRRWTVMMVTAGTLVGFQNDAIGFVVGMLCHFSFVVLDHFKRGNVRELLGENRPLLSS